MAARAEQLILQFNLKPMQQGGGFFREVFRCCPTADDWRRRDLASCLGAAPYRRDLKEPLARKPTADTNDAISTSVLYLLPEEEVASLHRLASAQAGYHRNEFRCSSSCHAVKDSMHDGAGLALLLWAANHDQ